MMVKLISKRTGRGTAGHLTIRQQPAFANILDYSEGLNSLCYNGASVGSARAE